MINPISIASPITTQKSNVRFGKLEDDSAPLKPPSKADQILDDIVEVKQTDNKYLNIFTPIVFVASALSLFLGINLEEDRIQDIQQEAVVQFEASGTYDEYDENPFGQPISKLLSTSGLFGLVGGLLMMDKVADNKKDLKEIENRRSED